jgi:hypothetical protein
MAGIIDENVVVFYLRVNQEAMSSVCYVVWHFRLFGHSMSLICLRHLWFRDSRMNLLSLIVVQSLIPTLSMNNSKSASLLHYDFLQSLTIHFQCAFLPLTHQTHYRHLSPPFPIHFCYLHLPISPLFHPNPTPTQSIHIR